MEKAAVNGAALRQWAARVREDFITFPMHVVSRPFKGFAAMKAEKRGKTHFAWAMVVALCLTQLAQETYTGFVLSGIYEPDNMINLPYVLFMTLAPVLLFIVGNWCITSIMNGKGRAVEIFQVYAYALYPQLILNIIGIVVSNMVTKEESAFAAFFFVFGTVAFLFYLFIGLIIIHEYNFTQAVGMVVLTILAMLIIVFVLALFLSLVYELVSFIIVIVTELRMKW